MFLTTLSLNMTKMKLMMTHNRTIPKALLFSSWSTNYGVGNDLPDHRHTHTQVREMWYKL